MKMKMKLNVPLLNEITLDLRKHVLANRLATVTIVNSTDFIFSFSVYRKEKMFVSLSHGFPFLTLVKIDESISTTGDKNSQILRKELKDAYITDISILNNDRVICFSLLKSNDYYEKEKRSLILELIPHRANMVLLDQNEHIIFVLHQNGLETSRPLMKGLIYQPLVNQNKNNEPASASLDGIKEYASNYIYQAKSSRLKERYHLLFKHIKSKIHSLDNKLITLEIEASRAKDNLINQEYGQTILSLGEDQKELESYLSDKNIEKDYDKSLSYGVNADRFFKKYKKAKRTLEMNKIEKEKSLEKLSYYQSLQNLLPYMNEDDLLELAKELLPHKTSKDVKKNTNKISYVEYKNTRIYFGKNSKQNELLTFKLAKKDYWYFHIKDTHGSHVVIALENPDNETRLIASEICLILANKKDGEIYTTQIGNIKKGASEGLALLKSYKSIYLHDIRECTIELLKHYKS